MLHQKVGTIVTLDGLALDAKGGAVLKVGDDIVYIAGLDCWPPALCGKPVRATGTLVEEKLLPDPAFTPGAFAAGAYGTQLVLRDAQWSALSV